MPLGKALALGGGYSALQRRKIFVKRSNGRSRLGQQADQPISSGLHLPDQNRRIIAPSRRASPASPITFDREDEAV
jgi:hypothetical protein